MTITTYILFFHSGYSLGYPVGYSGASSRAGLGQKHGAGILAQTGPQPSNKNTVVAPDQRKVCSISANKTTNIHVPERAIRTKM